MKPAFLISPIIHGLKAAREAHIPHQIPDISRQTVDTVDDENILHEEKIEPVIDVYRLTGSTLPTNDAK